MSVLEPISPFIVLSNPKVFLIHFSTIGRTSVSQCSMPMIVVRVVKMETGNMGVASCFMQVKNIAHRN